VDHPASRWLRVDAREDGCRCAQRNHCRNRASFTGRSTAVVQGATCTCRVTERHSSSSGGNRGLVRGYGCGERHRQHAVPPFGAFARWNDTCVNVNHHTTLSSVIVGTSQINDWRFFLRTFTAGGEDQDASLIVRCPSDVTPLIETLLLLVYFEFSSCFLLHELISAA
jgi:hypothetical protein